MLQCQYNVKVTSDLGFLVTESGRGEVVRPSHLCPRRHPVASSAVEDAVQGGLHVPPPVLEQKEN